MATKRFKYWRNSNGREVPISDLYEDWLLGDAERGYPNATEIYVEDGDLIIKD